MQKGQPIAITKVANGYLVRPEYPHEFITNFGSQRMLDENSFVFPNIIRLTDWLAEHFVPNSTQEKQQDEYLVSKEKR